MARKSKEDREAEEIVYRVEKELGLNQGKRKPGGCFRKDTVCFMSPIWKAIGIDRYIKKIFWK